MRKITRIFHLVIFSAGILIICLDLSFEFLFFLQHIPREPNPLGSICFGYCMATLVVKYVYGIKGNALNDL
jgi:NADH:ubiquinone oxidoreductase subunit 3 (subunit A)